MQKGKEMGRDYKTSQAVPGNPKDSGLADIRMPSPTEYEIAQHRYYAKNWMKSKSINAGTIGIAAGLFLLIQANIGDIGLPDNIAEQIGSLTTIGLGGATILLRFVTSDPIKSKKRMDQAIQKQKDAEKDAELDWLRNRVLAIEQSADANPDKVNLQPGVHNVRSSAEIAQETRPRNV